MNLTTKEIQTALKAAGFYGGNIDGMAGPLTKHGIVLFQTSEGLVADGIVGPKTEAALRKHLPTVAVTTADTRAPSGGGGQMPRGYRNANPGNIDFNAGNAWQGKLPRDMSIEPRFERFDSHENGIRAMVKLLLKYQSSYGLDTISGLIDRWAPPNENNTDAYKNTVARKTGIGINQRLGASLRSEQVMRALVEAIIGVELGRSDLYADAVLAEGVRRGLA